MVSKRFIDNGRANAHIISGLFVIVFFVSFAVLSYVNTAIAQDKSNAVIDKKLSELETELRDEINTHLEIIEKVSEETIKISNKALESSEKNLERTKEIYKVAGYIVAIIVAILGFFGFKELSDISRIRTDMEKELAQARETIALARNEIARANNIMLDLQNTLEKIKRQTNFLRADFLRDRAMLYAKKGAYLLALIEIDKAFGLIEKEDYETKAINYSVRAYLLHMLERYPEAYKAERRALALDASEPTLLYNTACTTAKLGRTEDALLYLRSALQRAPEYRKLVIDDRDKKIKDGDFEALMNKEEFKEMLGMTGIVLGLKPDIDSEIADIYSQLRQLQKVAGITPPAIGNRPVNNI